MAKSTRNNTPTFDASTRIAVLTGSEEMLKRQRLATLRAAIAAEHGEAETFSFDGKSPSPDLLAEVMDELRSYSLMQSYKVVIVDDADQFVKTHRPALERYAQKPVDHATLVLRSTTWHKGNLDKLIAKVGAVVKCEAMKPAEARDELLGRAKSVHGANLSKAGASLLVERLGPELMQLDTELAKLALMVEPGEPIEPTLIEQVVGRSSEEQAWSVQEAVLESLRTRSAGHAIAKIHELVDLGGQAEVLVMYFVADLMRKLNVAVLGRRAGASESDLAGRLKLWGSRRQLFFGAVRHLPEAEMGRLFDDALRADARSKSGFGEPVRNLECFCAAMTDKRG